MKKKVRNLLLAALCCVLCAGLAWGGWVWYDTNIDRSGWSREGRIVQYLDFHGEPLTHWQTIEEGRYYFGDNGVLRTGWQIIDDERYYFDTDGRMYTGTWDIAGKCYRFGDDGVMYTGWLEKDGLQYYFDANGAMVTGWAEIGLGLYYFDADGAMARSWREIDGSRYFFTDRGNLYTGWLNWEGNDYYFLSDGAMAVSPTEIDGQMYYFTPKGIPVVLVNPWNSLPQGYTPELVMTEDSYKVDARCLEDLELMLADCRAAGFDPMICSAYRSQAEQEWLFDRKVRTLTGQGMSPEAARKEAALSVAVPGTSEHQLGLALDIVARDYLVLNDSQATTQTQQWLMEHSWKYGFILRYPEGTTDITGIIYEPWHYRYVGREIAAELFELGITLEEYLGAAENGEPVGDHA